MILLLAALSFCMVSCNAKTEKVKKDFYEDFKKVPEKGKIVRKIWNDTKKEDAESEKENHINRRICSKCGGTGYINSVDYCGNKTSELCDMCVGTGYMFVIEGN